MSVLNQFSVKSKLIIILLSVSLGSVLVVGYLGWRTGRDALQKEVFNHLISVRTSRANQIETYFQTLRSLLVIFSEDDTVIGAMVRLNKSFKQLEYELIPTEWDAQLSRYYEAEFFPRLAVNVEGEPTWEVYDPKTQAAHYLQYHYLTTNENPVGEKHFSDDADDGSEYSQWHSHYHPFFRDLVAHFGFYDLFLIDFDTQEIVYSVYKEVDYATSLFDGPYTQSSLAEVVAKVRQQPQKGAVQIVDFQPYVPSYGAPAGFMATPIYNGPHRVGILVIQLPVDELNTIMTGGQNWQADGLGESGETYLVGSDLLMRSNSRFLIEDADGYRDALRAANVPLATIQAIEQFGTSILQQKISTAAAQAAISGQIGAEIIQDYRNISVLSVYQPLQIQGLEWAVITEKDLSEVNRPVVEQQRILLVATAILVLVVTLLAILLSYRFVAPLNTLIEATQQVSAGQLDTTVTSRTNDEFGRLADNFNRMIQNLKTQNDLLTRKERENDALLLSLLPDIVAERVKQGELQIADKVQQVTVIFVNIAGFEALSAQKNVQEVARLLNELVDSFDEAADHFGVERQEVIGERYLAVCSLSTMYLDHVERTLNFALETLLIMDHFNQTQQIDLGVQIGIHTGPVMAGIVGTRKFRYSLWGETPNRASDIQAMATWGDILVSQAVYERCHDSYLFEPQETITLENETLLQIWSLKGRERPDAKT